MKRFELLTNLPSVLSCIILQDWLVLKSVIALDSAYCCHSHRNMFLDLLELNQYFVREQVTIASQGLILNAMQKYGEKFRFVLFADKLSSAEGNLVVSHCRNLTRVRFNGCKACTPELRNISYQNVDWLDLSGAYRTTCMLLQVPQLCPLLKSVGLAGTDLTDHMLNKITAACPHIVHIDIAFNNLLTDAGILHMVTNLKGMRGLNIEHNRQLTDASLVNIYTHCAGTLHAIYMSCNEFDSIFPQASMFSGAAVNNLLERCTQLRTLFLDRYTFRTGISLQISPTAIKNITMLVLGSSNLVPNDYVNSIGQYFTNLHTLAINDPLLRFSVHDLTKLARECVNLKELYLQPKRWNEFQHIAALEGLYLSKPWLVVKPLHLWSELSKYEVMNL